MKKAILSDALQLSILDDLYAIHPLTPTWHGFVARFGHPEDLRLVANVRQLIRDGLITSNAVAEKDESEYIRVSRLQLTANGHQFIADNPPHQQP
ncbi:hypothetical protein D3C76_947450 [compost metagenome]|uniref:MarR family transcriptional regulator n=1 Tax=Serratia liquefaciens TaxID=614 RepID=A0ABX7D033_SERLI|nr:hypothetical protein [Serratia liquefaciens]QQU53681.1 hypothetical protein I6I38_15205 [Serratia liquefaciens]